MATQGTDRLNELHTALLDSLHGYEEALEDAGPRGMTTLFQQMIALRTAATAELEPAIVSRGETAGSSLMSAVHRTVISIRSLFNDLDESILPGLIDGERRILQTYDEALQAPDLPLRETVMRQRAAVVEKIKDMEVLAAKAA